MFERRSFPFRVLIPLATTLMATLVSSLAVLSGAAAAEPQWRVAKMSGDVRVGTASTTTVALAVDAVLGPGTVVATGRNGRVLLVRGRESILVSPGSVMALPDATAEDGSTTILQRAGTLLLDVDKQPVQHFSVETPYLAAVVKGTQFRVTVGSGSSDVEVVNGAVEVTALATGRHAVVLAEQSASVSSSGPVDLSLRGPGRLNPILPGQPRPSLVAPPTDRSARQAADASEHRDGAVGAAPTTAPTTNTRLALSWPTRGDGTELMPTDDRAHGWYNPLRSAFEHLGDVVTAADSLRYHEDATMTIAVSSSVGTLVAFGVAIERRRRRRRK
ncbi:MAG: FecR domain-containing protein [Rhodovulum sp.]|nr:FecR domain-containing protein [Rhodovulum sp.]